MRRENLGQLAALFVLPLCLLFDGLLSRALADGFSIEDVEGSYGSAFSGSFTEDPASPLPISAVAQFTADEGAVGELTRTLNLGGFALIDSRFQGRALVEPDGRGVAAFCGENRVRPPAAPDVFPSKTLEIFDFVLTARNSDEIEFIGTGLFALPSDFDLRDCPAPDEPPIGSPLSAVVIGTARRQDDGKGDPGDEDDDD